MTRQVGGSLGHSSGVVGIVGVVLHQLRLSEVVGLSDGTVRDGILLLSLVV